MANLKTRIKEAFEKPRVDIGEIEDLCSNFGDVEVISEIIQSDRTLNYLIAAELYKRRKNLSKAFEFYDKASESIDMFIDYLNVHPNCLTFFEGAAELALNNGEYSRAEKYRGQVNFLSRI